MEKFFVWAFLLLASGIIFSKLTFLSLPVFVPALLFIFSFLLFRANLFFPVFFFSIFVLGLSIGKYERLENKFYRNGFVGCITTSVPYVSERFTAFECYVVQTDRSDILHRAVDVYIRGENRKVFLGSSVHFFGKINISDNIIKAYPYQYFVQIDNSKNPFYLIYWLKNKLIERYKKLSDGDETFRMGLALIFGEKGYLGKEKEDFINAGTSHLLAISGMHVGMIILILLFVFRFSRKLSYYISLLFLSVYPLFTGLHVPVVRASFLGNLYLISKLKYLKVNSLNLLFFVGFIVLLFSPDSLFSVSFQLSFIAVLGLLLYSDLLNVRHKNAVVRYMGSSFLMSVVAVLFTSPVVLYYFGKFSLTTIVATPVLILILFPYLFFSVFNLFTFFSFYPAVYLMEMLGKIFIEINSAFAGLEFIHYGFSPSIVNVCMYLLVMIFIAILKIRIFYKMVFSLFSFFLFLALSGSTTDKWEVFVFKRKRYPEIAVITPYGECFFKGFSRKLKTVMDRRGCRKRFLIGYYDQYEAVTRIRLDNGAVIINGVKYRLENRNYRFYPAPVK